MAAKNKSAKSAPVSGKQIDSGPSPNESNLSASSPILPCFSQKTGKHQFTWCAVFLSAIVFAIISQILHSIDAVLTMSFYTNPANFSLWSKAMMPAAGSPPASFFALSLIVNFLTGLAFAYVYTLIRSSIKHDSLWKTGAYFGVILFMVSLPGFASLYLTVAVPPLLLADWIIWSFIISLAGAAAIAKIID